MIVMDNPPLESEHAMIQDINEPYIPVLQYLSIEYWIGQTLERDVVEILIHV